MTKTQEAERELRCVVLGCGGRMGRMLLRAVMERQGLKLHAAIAPKGSALIGQDAGLVAGEGRAAHVMISDSLERVLPSADLLLDFSAPSATVQACALAAQYGVAHVIGTTGLSEAQEASLRSAAERIPIVYSGNMSLGVQVLANLVERAAHALGMDFDIEICEMHHRNKVDAPSGTALLLGHAAAKGRSVPLSSCILPVREGHTGPRPKSGIGFSSLRGGSVVGTHTVILAGNGERVELRHVAEERDIFARGAVQAGIWLWGRPVGLYSMADVLELSSKA